MSTSIVLFTRDLRVHDHPGLMQGAAAGPVVPLFVLDQGVFDAGFARPNRTTFLIDSLTDLRRRLSDLGGDLVVRRGDVVGETVRLANAHDADTVWVAEDVSRYAQRRQRRLEEAGNDAGFTVKTHPALAIVPPGAVEPSGSDHYAVFTPYWRKWKEHGWRKPVDPPDSVELPAGIEAGAIPAAADLVTGDPSPDLLEGGETAGRERMERWITEDAERYQELHDDLAAGGTSQLGADLHFGCVSPLELATRLDRRKPGHDAYVRQLCWRDFYLQLMAARPEIAVEDYRSQGDRWFDDEASLTAWKEGRTGYPIVDAGMRQLAREGWMHNRARLVVGSFLTKHLYLDWRHGARHFFDLLVDGDMASNIGNWQWVAGTGTDTRPNRMFNPIRQAERYDPHGDYVRRYVPELSAIEGSAVHEPWKLGPLERSSIDYPEPIVDHDEARDRFLQIRKG